MGQVPPGGRLQSLAQKPVNRASASSSRMQRSENPHPPDRPSSCCGPGSPPHSLHQPCETSPTPRQPHPLELLSAPSLSIKLLAKHQYFFDITHTELYNLQSLPVSNHSSCS